MKKKAIYLLGEATFEDIYGPDEQKSISELVDVIAPPQTIQSVKENPEILSDVEIIFSGWGMAKLDAEFLAAAPKLEAVFYGAGSVRGFITNESFDRNIVVTSSYDANAIPVAEACVAELVFCLKNGPQLMRATRETKEWQNERKRQTRCPGVYKSTVGLVSLGMIGKHVLKLLKSYDVNIAVFSTSMTDGRAAEMGVKNCTLDEIFKISDAISIHTASLPETKGMITGDHIASMKKNASLINTSRGAVIQQKEMLDALEQRPDLTAMLDVTDPEPPVLHDRIYELDNVFLTPHIAGSMFDECRRMGQYAIDECKRYLNGEPRHYEVTPKMLETMA